MCSSEPKNYEVPLSTFSSPMAIMGRRQLKGEGELKILWNILKAYCSSCQLSTSTHHPRSHRAEGLILTLL